MPDRRNRVGRQIVFPGTLPSAFGHVEFNLGGRDGRHRAAPTRCAQRLGPMPATGLIGYLARFEPAVAFTSRAP
jgi:hypothetical protein